MMLKPGLRDFKRKMSTEQYGGAPVMGVAKPVFKAHGNSNATAFKNAILRAKEFASENAVGIISQAIGNIK